MTTMRALVRIPGGVELVERPRPTPQRGEVLVRIEAAPINPNDLLHLEERYEVQRPLGAVCGFEGSGTVIEAGGGMMARWLVGRRVALASTLGDGTWAEYACAPMLQCAPLGKGVDVRQGSMLLTNPMTATVLLDLARRGGHRAIVQNAAAGALGKMIVRACARRGIPLVNVVRRAEQAAMLRELGAQHVVVSSDADAATQLRELCHRLDVTFALDAIAGDATGELAAALPKHATLVVYGMLSGAPCTLSADALVFGRLRVEGFTMYAWLERTSMLGKLMTLRAAQRRLHDDLRADVRATFSLADHAEALRLARSSASDGKILFTPQ
ncbi:MAG TPA: zinc-binding dehydrogenase [Nannocystaceae bacterium]|nr:zinc-binding dehydrogenase [Nannocystaceae bacterium]